MVIEPCSAETAGRTRYPLAATEQKLGTGWICFEAQPVHSDGGYPILFAAGNMVAGTG